MLNIGTFFQVILFFVILTMFFFSFLHSGGWGYGPRYEGLSEMIRKNVPSAEIEGHVGRRSTNVLFALFS
jgi:hypothetical protein